MTYEEASMICSISQLTAREQQAYDALLQLLDEHSAEAPLNLFPLVMHFVSDAMASQIAQDPLHTREDRIVTLTEDVLAMVRRLRLAKCIVAGELPEETPS